MKLLNDLFEIVESSGNEASFSVTVRIFSDHIVYKGHFPGYPVTPGVILIQMVHELVQHCLKRTIRLVEMSNCKFLKIVNPNQETLAVFSFDVTSKNGLIYVKGFGKNTSGIFFKLNTVYIG